MYLILTNIWLVSCMNHYRYKRNNVFINQCSLDKLFTSTSIEVKITFPFP